MARLQEGGRKEGEKWEIGCEGGGCMMGGREGCGERDVGMGRRRWEGGSTRGRRNVREVVKECSGGSAVIPPHKVTHIRLSSL